MARLTPIKAIRSKCLDCSCTSPQEVRLCTIKTCRLYPYRMGKRPTTKPERTPVKTIRAYCLDCSNQQATEVRLCTVVRCSLYPYRMGKRPSKD